MNHLYYCPLCHDKYMKQSFNLEKNLCKKCVLDLFISGKEMNKKQVIKDTIIEPYVDNTSNLMWEIKSDNLLNAVYNWKNLQNYIHYLNEAKYAGYSDWRLPTIAECESLYFQRKPPLYTAEEFDKETKTMVKKIKRRSMNMMAYILLVSISDNMPSFNPLYWTSDKYNSYKMLLMNFSEKDIYVLSKESFASVRCVRNV